MGTTKWLVVAVATALAAPAFAHEGSDDQRSARKTEIIVAPYVGGAHLKIDPAFSEGGERRGEDLGMIGVSLGIRLPVGLVFEAGRSDARHDDLSDWWSAGLGFTQKYAAVGWAINLGDEWQLTPKFGRAKWELDADDIDLVLPNGEISDRMNGYDNFAEATLSKSLTDNFALGLSVRGIETEFGESISGAIAATWSF